MESFLEQLSYSKFIEEILLGNYPDERNCAEEVVIKFENWVIEDHYLQYHLDDDRSDAWRDFCYEIETNLTT